jgi:hypothetical protein
MSSITAPLETPASTTSVFEPGQCLDVIAISQGEPSAEQPFAKGGNWPVSDLAHRALTGGFPSG